MSVYPLVFHIGPLEITGYGLMMMAGFLMAGWVIQRTLQEQGLSEGYAADVIVAGVIGGILGAKLWYVVLYGDPRALISRGGLVWYGGFVGGAAAVLFNSWRRHIPLRFTLEWTAPGLAIGYALGRVGCFLVQDDYGLPTSLPWGLRFPEGLPPSTAYNLSTMYGVEVAAGTSPTEVLAVHPTQLYEVTIMLIVFWILWRLHRHQHAVGWLFGLYLLLAGIERFLVEFLRAKDDRVLGTFTISQATAVAACVLGVALMVRWSQRDQLAIPAEAMVLQPRPPSG
jgi:phosphatidylglycerol:prolipoprotein diacylglycerol transferase